MQVEKLHFRRQTNAVLPQNMQPRYLTDQTGNFNFIFYSVKRNPAPNVIEFYSFSTASINTGKMDFDI